MKRLNKILRFRFPNEIVDQLGRIERKSDYVRAAVREKMERDGLIKIEKSF